MALTIITAAEAAASETTLHDTVQGLVSKPEETLSALGVFFESLLNGIIEAVPSIILALIILIVGIILTKLSVKLMSKGLSKTKLDLTVVKFSTQVARIVLYVLLITIVLSMLGIPSTSIITVIGTAGVAVGLALQDSLKNVAGGFLLMILKPFKIGDFIISNGVEGTVSQISILHTRLDSVTNQAIYVPNGLVINAVVVNNNGNDTRRVSIDFPISYEADFARAQKIITDVIKACPEVDCEREIFVRMTGHGESAVTITAKAWCKTEDFWNVRFFLLENVKAAFDENGIEIPFNQLDVNIRK